MIKYQKQPIICDYLDVTYEPDSPVVDEVLSFISPATSDIARGSDHVSVTTIGGGVLRLESRARFTRISASGAVLEDLRRLSLFNDYLSLLSERPHNVTRLDAALDSYEDTPPVLKRLRRKYHNKTVNLGRKGLPHNVMLEHRQYDGVLSGSMQIGHRSQAQASVTVYDKRQQMFKHLGAELTDPWTRYELRVRGQHKPTLRDAAEPDRIFWHFMSPAILKAPKGVEPWESGWGGGWESEKPEKLPAAALKRLIENSAVLEQMAKLAVECGPSGLDYMLGLVDRRLETLHGRLESAARSKDDEQEDGTSTKLGGNL